MCTVIFMPNGNTFYFASLRDESPSRPAAWAPSVREVSGVSILSPVDAKAGGTWIGISAMGNIIILLNGGFENHIKKTHYRKSRGEIVTALLATAAPVTEWKKMHLENIAPFTLVVWMQDQLYQLVWDGVNKQHLKLETGKPAIWSSATLYNAEAKLKRNELFNKWIALNIPVSAASLMELFTSTTDNENGFLINRSDRIQTLSYSFIELEQNKAAGFEYADFLNNRVYKEKIHFHTNSVKPVYAAPDLNER